jgi:hypothetical protein
LNIHTKKAVGAFALAFSKSSIPGITFAFHPNIYIGMLRPAVG